jgi:hypothetical protein
VPFGLTHFIFKRCNHDFCFERQNEAARRVLAHAAYLQDDGLTIEGVSFWGSPWQPWFHDWAFNLPRGSALAEKWSLIPAQTDVLITHGPPMGHGDRTFRGEAVGCRDLMERVLEVRPQLHVFGHIHEGYGTTTQVGITFANASVCDLRYRAVQAPLVFDVPCLRSTTG